MSAAITRRCDTAGWGMSGATWGVVSAANVIGNQWAANRAICTQDVAAAGGLGFVGGSVGGAVITRMTSAAAGLRGSASVPAAAKADGATLFRNRGPGDPLMPGRTVPLDRLSGINGQFQYVIPQDGSLVVGRGSHIDLSRGAPVRGAGEVRVVNGEVRMLNNYSGHYRPSGAGLEGMAKQAFDQQAGLTVRDGAWVAR